MRKQISWLLAILTLTALVSSDQRTPERTGRPPSPCPPVQSHDPDWVPAGLLSHGTVLHAVSTTGSEPGIDRILPTGEVISGKQITATFSVALGEADHRWTQYGPLQARVEGRKIVLECQVLRYNKPHIQNYMPSTVSVGPARLTGLQGDYEIVLGGRKVGSASFEADSKVFTESV